MKDTEALRRRIMRYLDGVANEDEVAALGQRLAADPETADLFAEECRLHAAMERHFEAGGHASVATFSVPAKKKRAHSLPWMRYAAVAALILLLGALGWGISRERTEGTATQPDLTEKKGNLAEMHVEEEDAGQMMPEATGSLLDPAKVRTLLAGYFLPPITMSELPWPEAVQQLETELHGTADSLGDVLAASIRFVVPNADSGGIPETVDLDNRGLPALLQLEYLAARAGRRLRYGPSSVTFSEMPESERTQAVVRRHRVTSAMLAAGNRLTGEVGPEPPDVGVIPQISGEGLIAELGIATPDDAAFEFDTVRGRLTVRTNLAKAEEIEAVLNAAKWELPEVKVATQIWKLPPDALVAVSETLVDVSDGTLADAEGLAGKLALEGVADHVFETGDSWKAFAKILAKQRDHGATPMSSPAVVTRHGQEAQAEVSGSPRSLPEGFVRSPTGSEVYYPTGSEGYYNAIDAYVWQELANAALPSMGDERYAQDRLYEWIDAGSYRDLVVSTFNDALPEEVPEKGKGPDGTLIYWPSDSLQLESDRTVAAGRDRDGGGNIYVQGGEEALAEEVRHSGWRTHWGFTPASRMGIPAAGSTGVRIEPRMIGDRIELNGSIDLPAPQYRHARVTMSRFLGGRLSVEEIVGAVERVTGESDPIKLDLTGLPGDNERAYTLTFSDDQPFEKPGIEFTTTLASGQSAMFEVERLPDGGRVIALVSVTDKDG